MNKRGVLGLETVKPFMVILLTLAVVTIALFLSFTSLDSTIGTEGTLTNNTINMTQSGAFPTGISGLTQPSYASLTITNATGVGTAVITTDYTVDPDTGKISAVAGSVYDGLNMNVSATYKDKWERSTDELTTNSTTATTSFFSNIPTAFTILGAVVIILAVTLILFAVNRFSAGSNLSSGGGSGGSGRESRL